MSVSSAYNSWSNSYDVVENRTRDIEAIALQKLININTPIPILELGCGTGKNTSWLSTKATSITAVDFSVEMMNVAKNKITAANVIFQQLDITHHWNFCSNQFELITCSLILEHIKNLNHIFEQANNVLKKEGLFYIGELHPFKQYLGSKARFEIDNETVVLECYTHHISDYYKAAALNNFECIEIQEWFDESKEQQAIPRILTMLFKKK